MKLHQKMQQVMATVGQLTKDKAIYDRNGKKMYDYLSEETTTSELQKAFIEAGLVMLPIDIQDEFFYIEGIQYDKPFKTPITRVVVTYKIVDTDSGEFETIKGLGYGTDSQDKGSNKAMTGAFKYAQRQSFMISTGDDGDHEVMGAVSGPKQPTPPPTPPTPPKQPAPSYKATNADLLKKLAEDGDLEAKCKELYGQLSNGDLSEYDKFIASRKKKGEDWTLIYAYLTKKK